MALRPLPVPGLDARAYLLRLYEWLRPFQYMNGLRVSASGIDVERASSPTTDGITTLTWTFDGLNATLGAGLLMLRGEKFEVEAATIALSNPLTKCWLLFTVQPGVDPEPEVQTGDDWPGTVDLGVHGWWPLAEFETVAGVGEGAPRVLSSKRFHHAGGTIDYSL